LKTFDLRELLHIIPRQDYLLVLEEARYFMEDSVIGEIHNLLETFSGQKTKAGPGSGFELQ
jgi:hypothetical protein